MTRSLWALKMSNDNSGDHRVAHRILLVEEARVCARLHVEPRSPLVHHKADAVFGVVPVHDLRMVGNQFVHMQCFSQRLIILRLGEVRRGAFFLPGAGNGVIVQRNAVHEAPGAFHHLCRPVVVVRIGPAGDFKELVFAVIIQVGLVTAVNVGVIFRAHVSAAAPRSHCRRRSISRSQGFSRPFARRRSAIGDTPSKFMYSTHSLISRTVPLPRLPQTYGSQPS